MGTGGESFHPTPRAMIVKELQRTTNRFGQTVVQIEITYRVSGVVIEWMTLATAIKAGYVNS
jgi:hypothetical protein